MFLSQSPPPAPPPRRRSSARPAPTTGVKVVTRKVIRTLEGLEHTMEETEVVDETEVAAALRADRRQGKQRAVADKPVVKKIDWEIPRKVFHSSIGRWHSLYYNSILHANECIGFITLGLYLTPSMSPRGDGGLVVCTCLERVYERLLGFLMRESERTGTNSTLWYILGVNFALTFYPIDVATARLTWTDLSSLPMVLMSEPRPPMGPVSFPGHPGVSPRVQARLVNTVAPPSGAPALRACLFGTAICLLVVPCVGFGG
ncbi:hypothetical protein MVEN_02358800 [Mycena venus]|uniref:Uncharacterized protein n=1 Tax=Mycena venus TaxID=2733690 RepID=A0A8H7CDQ9_9AGAR|nr:hypothetical protein MVEN_02358800 [Mycena venus]